VPKAQTVTVKARGLYDPGNNPWALPDGALLEAENVEIGRDNVVRPRPGFRSLVDQSASAGSAYGDGLVVIKDTTGVMARSQNGGLSWVAYSGTYPQPTWPGGFTRFAQASKSLFFTGSAGVYSLDDITASSPRISGVAPALDIKFSALNATTATAVAASKRVAYRYVFGRKDYTGRIILGVPSSRLVVDNTAGGVRNVDLILTIPAEVSDGTHFVQLYRTSASVDLNTDPGDECYQVWEAAVASGGVITTVSVTDSTPDGLGGASLYTNPSQETILGGNERPPLALDLAPFAGSMWYADVTYPARQIVHLLGVTGNNGLANNDTITINAQAFTAKNTAGGGEVIGSRYFWLATSAEVTPATEDSAMRATVNSLIRCINRTSAAGAYALDISEPAPSGIPGSISIQRTDRTSTLTITVSRSTAWSPAAGATVAPVRYRNGLVYSKSDQPDAVSTALSLAPILVGSGLEEIKRIVATRSSLWVFKDDGVWRVTGSAGQFDVQVFDPTVRLLFPQTAVALDNLVYFWSDQGICRLSETGVEIISTPIRGFTQFATPALVGLGVFAVADDKRNRYVLCVATYIYYVFDTVTEVWTRWGGSGDSPWADFGLIEPYSGLLAVCTSQYWKVERSSGDGTNQPVYVNDSVAVTTTGDPVAIGDGYYTVAVSAIPSYVVGDLLVLGGTGTITGELAAPARLVIRDVTLPFSPAGAALVYRSFAATVTYAVKNSAPATLAEWQEAAMLFGNLDGNVATVTLTGDSGSDSAITIDKTDSPGTSRQIRVWPGRVSSLSGTMRLSYSERVAYAYGITPTELAGVVWTFSPQGDGVSR
jgi:hypothetical protein